MCPKGDLAVAAILRGSNNKKAFFYQKNGSLSILKIDGKKVTKTQDIEVGGLPEAVAFTPDGKYILAGNLPDPGFLDPEGRRHQGHRHRQALQGAGPSGLGADGALEHFRRTESDCPACREVPRFRRDHDWPGSCPPSPRRGRGSTLSSRSRRAPFELPHRFAAREQAFGGVIGRHLDQRAIDLDARLTCSAGSLERRDDLARVANLILVRREHAVDDRGMRRINQAFGDISQSSRPARIAPQTFDIAPRIRDNRPQRHRRRRIRRGTAAGNKRVRGVLSALGAEVSGEVFGGKQAGNGPRGSPSQSQRSGPGRGQTRCSAITPLTPAGCRIRARTASRPHRAARHGAVRRLLAARRCRERHASPPQDRPCRPARAD